MGAALPTAAGPGEFVLEWAERALHDRQDHFPALCWAVASAAHLGLQAKARDFRDRLLRGIPGVDLGYLENVIPYQRPEHAARLSEGFRMAGFQSRS